MYEKKWVCYREMTKQLRQETGYSLLKNFTGSFADLSGKGIVDFIFWLCGLSNRV
jgi:hypothetical protein